ncbi:MAG: glycolate oxidase subunit GlcE [Limnohabitans sp.]|nr:glycolate oxidase subunit GlcE [Limnohabitans sp.]
MSNSLQAWIDQISAAAQAGRVLSIEGGATKRFYGEITQSNDILNTRAHSGIVSYEPSELYITGKAGTPLIEIEDALKQRNQCLAFEPPHFFDANTSKDSTTVGGMVACGLAGPSRAQAGGVRDYVLGVEMINGRAQTLTFGGQVMKNVAGYDVSRLMAASMGVLGVITVVSLKVLPIAPAQNTIECADINQTQALKLLHQWGVQALPLNASCWVQDALYIRLRGAVAAVQSATERMQSELKLLGKRVQVIDQAQAQLDWVACAKQTLPFFQQAPKATDCLWRLSVAQTAAPLSLPYPSLIEWQGGLRWVWAPASAVNQLRETAKQAGGHATLFRTSQANADADKKVGVFTPLPAVKSKIQQQLQQQMDPMGVFNTGRIQL